MKTNFLLNNQQTTEELVAASLTAEEKAAYGAETVTVASNAQFFCISSKIAQAFSEQTSKDVKGLGIVAHEKEHVIPFRDAVREQIELIENGASAERINASIFMLEVIAEHFVKAVPKAESRKSIFKYEPIELNFSRSYDSKFRPMYMAVVNKADTKKLSNTLASFDFVSAVKGSKLGALKTLLAILEDVIRVYDLGLQQHIDAFKNAYDNVSTPVDILKTTGIASLDKNTEIYIVRGDVDKHVQQLEETSKVPFTAVGNVIIKGVTKTQFVGNKVVVLDQHMKNKLPSLEVLTSRINAQYKRVQNMKFLNAEYLMSLRKAQDHLVYLSTALAFIKYMNVKLAQTKSEAAYGLQFVSDDDPAAVSEFFANLNRQNGEYTEHLYAALSTVADKVYKDKDGNAVTKPLSYIAQSMIARAIGDQFNPESMSNAFAMKMPQSFFYIESLHKNMIEDAIDNPEAYGFKADTPVAEIEETLPQMPSKLELWNNTHGTDIQFDFHEYAMDEAVFSSDAVAQELESGSRHQFINGTNPLFKNIFNFDAERILKFYTTEEGAMGAKLLTEIKPVLEQMINAMKAEAVDLFAAEVHYAFTKDQYRYEYRDIEDYGYENAGIFEKPTANVVKIDRFNNNAADPSRVFFVGSLNNGGDVLPAIYSYNKSYHDGEPLAVKFELPLSVTKSNVQNVLGKAFKTDMPNPHAQLNEWKVVQPLNVGFSASRKGFVESSALMQVIDVIDEELKATLVELINADEETQEMAKTINSHKLKKHETIEERRSAEEVASKMEEEANNPQPETEDAASKPADEPTIDGFELNLDIDKLRAQLENKIKESYFIKTEEAEETETEEEEDTVVVETEEELDLDDDDIEEEDLDLDEDED